MMRRNEQHRLLSKHGGRWVTTPARAARRRATVLVLVMTVLGILFVTGLAFMATMNFESEMIEADKRRRIARPDLLAVNNELAEILENGFGPTTIGDLSGSLLGSSSAAFAEMPGVHNLFAPTEPYKDEYGTYRLLWLTDLEAITRSPFEGSKYFRPDSPTTVDPPGLPTYRVQPGSSVDVTRMGMVPSFPGEFRVLLDADGDGIVDSIQVELRDPNARPAANEEPWIRFSRRQLEGISKAVNPVSKSNGKVYLGLRLIAHGAMVNVNESHPSLIRNILVDVDDDDYDYPYNPATEEPSLRRRNFLPARNLPPTKMQGNPLSNNSETRDGDFANPMFPPGTGFDEHRYWPIEPDRMGEPSEGMPAEDSYWGIRLDPAYASDNITIDHYDQRHLLTTVSYDDLLARPTLYQEAVMVCSVGSTNPGNPCDANAQCPDGLGYGYCEKSVVFQDCVAKMRDRNKIAAAGACIPQPDPLFPYAEYPNGDNWPNAFAGQTSTNDAPEAVENDCECALDSECEPNPLKGRLRLSLPYLDDMANFADIDERNLLIQNTFTLLLLNARGSEWGTYQPIGNDPNLNGYGPLDGTYDEEEDCDKNGEIVLCDRRVPKKWESDYDKISETAAALTANMIDFMDIDEDPTLIGLRESDPKDANFGLPTGAVIYGLERQPFITEIVALVEDDGTGSADMAKSVFGVELFNPTSAPIDLDDYEIRAPDTGGILRPYPLTGMLASNSFRGFFGPEVNESVLPPIGGTRQIIKIDTATNEFSFDQEPTIKLVYVFFDGVTTVRVVVDQWDLTDTTVGEPLVGAALVSARRFVNPSYEWTAAFPIEAVDAVVAGGESFGILTHGHEHPELLPMRIFTGGTGTFQTAFPTTGTMLLLVRHANQPLNLATGSGDAFTTQLASQWGEIDAGRMPVFDAAGSYKHHVDPAIDPTIDPVFAVDRLGKDKPGDLHHLPWGQLVFDYFTALPLDNKSPNNSGLGPDAAQPRVDQNGLRVHGRINLNAAPWKVLEGLPYIPMDQMPGDFDDDLALALNINAANYATSTPIGEELAKAIVAYRELREIDTNTGNYGVDSTGPDPNGRDWEADSPRFRRGMGFMSVGELANVRHNSAANGAFRIDDDWPNAASWATPVSPFYLPAIAKLVALGDWVTVRSHVFTVYGTLRGERDPEILNDAETEPDVYKQIIDADSRALRFQETVNRLPTFLGAEKPVRIGERTMAKYTDTIGD